MGIVYGFTRVTAAEFDRVLADPTCVDEVLEGDRPADASVYLDKSLWDLQTLLDRAEVPVDVLFNGHSLEREWDVVSVWSADQVESAAGDLRDVPFERLARHLDETPDEVDYLRHHYENLVRFLVATAATRSPAIYSSG